METGKRGPQEELLSPTGLRSPFLVASLLLGMTGQLRARELCAPPSLQASVGVEAGDLGEVHLQGCTCPSP